MRQTGKQEGIWTAWVERHRGILIKTARAFAPPGDHDDLMQEILLNLWRAIPNFRGDSGESTFVYRVAHNTALTWQRSRIGYRNRMAGLLRQSEIVSSPPQQDDAIERLYNAIRSLPEADRSLLLLHLDELSYREIAAVSGITESNVGARLTRIRLKLAHRLEGESQ